jgi:hypothetical protein
VVGIGWGGRVPGESQLGRRVELSHRSRARWKEWSFGVVVAVECFVSGFPLSFELVEVVVMTQSPIGGEAALALRS